MSVMLRRSETALRFINGDPPEEHEWPASWVNRHLHSGHVSLSRDTLTVHTEDGEDDVVYTIVARPGVYCCKCGARLGDQAADQNVADPVRRQEMADGYRAHVAECDGDGEDPQNPAGYRATHAFHTVKEG